jgi:hypothetical protein
MATNGKLEVEVEVKSNAEKFWNTLKDCATIFPKAFPNDYKSIEILEGDGKSAGSIRLLTFGEGVLKLLSFFFCFLFLFLFLFF